MAADHMHHGRRCHFVRNMECTKTRRLAYAHGKSCGKTEREGANSASAVQQQQYSLDGPCVQGPAASHRSQSDQFTDLIRVFRVAHTLDG